MRTWFKSRVLFLFYNLKLASTGTNNFVNFRFRIVWSEELDFNQDTKDRTFS